EQVGYAYHQAHGLEVINIRPGVIDGDGLNAGPVVPEGPIENPWFVYVDPRDIAQAVELSLEADQVKWGTFNIVAGRCDSLFDWTEARDQLGYQPEYNWPEIPEKGGSL
ncbi:MAG: hypothetical protein QGH20_09725, partial [Candidatus Latescibacteria bacterium]|nr:hypothetical protein [Candidatus Latescibacterota bacterium]